jgi:glycogen operon protein
MFDLTLFDDDHFHATDTGDERRPQQLRNFFTLLLLSAGPAMFVMGDEFARTQAGNPNPYNIDGPISWVDWERPYQWGHLTEYVREVMAVRKAWTRGEFRFHGVDVEPDLTWGSHSLAWCSGNLYVLANAWREPLRFGIHEPGEWHAVLSTAGYDDGVVPAHSVVVLRRPR